jgi:hypothetical protein
MNVKLAKAVARHWVIEEAATTPGFAGAFFHGSVNALPDEARLPATSDVDVMIVLDGAPPQKPGKFVYRNLLLEISYLSSDQLRSAEQILGRYDLAGSFRSPSVILDPTGYLNDLQETVGKEFARRQWVYRRCVDARGRVLRNLRSLNESDALHDQVMAWLFAAGVTTHILLVAGLRNPTVRKRYVAVRELLTEFGRLDFYETLLALLGAVEMSRTQVERHLAALTEAFDAAKGVERTPFFFASDISDLARPIAIGGSRELISRGLHREAVFWIVATASRCQKIFQHDSPPDTQRHFAEGYRLLLADLGITSFADLQWRSQQVEDSLPAVWQVAEAIIAANPAITD